MTRVQLTPEEINALAKKLDRLGESVTERERAVLLGVFGMASSSIKEVAAKARSEKRSVPSEVHGKAESALNTALGRLPPLSRAFKDAFAAGAVSQFQIDGLSPLEDSIGVSVGGPCVSVGWSMDLKPEADEDEGI